MKTHAELKKALLRDPQVRAEYDALEDELALIETAPHDQAA